MNTPHLGYKNAVSQCRTWHNLLCSGIHTKQINATSEYNVKLLYVNPCNTERNRWALNG